MARAIFQFPSDFLWGTATADHQVEGQSNDSWTYWENLQNNKVYQNQRAGLACDWWGGRWREDFERMSYLGHNTHRLSIAWSRIQPDAHSVDDSAIATYREWFQDLQTRNIRPMVTLHHFTNPMWFEEEGGWLSSKSVERFVRWAEIAVDAFGDYVDFWCTFNEPMVYVAQAYLVGFFYPGQRSLRKMFKAIEHILRAHAGAYQIIKAKQPQAQIGLAKHIVIFESIWPHFINQIPVRLIHQGFNMAVPRALASGELKMPLQRKIVIPELGGTYDYVGLNYYQRYKGGFSPMHPQTLFLTQKHGPDAPPAPEQWGEIYPQGLQKAVGWVWNTLRKPIYITETGAPATNDEIRQWYIIMILIRIWRVINGNIPIKGIYYWTLLDNFEWIAAYNPEFRFGLYEVDFETQVRTLRPSGALFRDITLANAITSEIIEHHAPQFYEGLFPGEAGLQSVKFT
ncbi:MAG: hypothetical protein CUN55_13415 [Phototrophicales bacterium]|nr:MAG: hypothetical protein CUN55_13415 [Phototrophicales bacterium]